METEGNKVINKLRTIKKRYDEINKLLTEPDYLNNIEAMKKLLKEQANMEELINIYNHYEELLTNIDGAKELLNDNELKALAKEELIELEQAKEQLENQIQQLLIPKDENDDKNVIIEIRGAAGGDEANLFAGDLYRMYTKYAEKNNWHIEEINSVEGSSGGYAQVEFLVKGTNVYSKLKYESGAHRVQRVPMTESQGRVHTSTATVLVMPEVEDFEIELKDSDLKIDVYRSSGSGGQSVNTTDSAVRITHLPTNIVVTCQTERSQIKNKERALKVLKSKIYDEKRREQEANLSSERKSKIGTGDRSEKIRTYNYPQNRITDHRINLSLVQLDKIMDGHLDEIVQTLAIEDQKRQLKE